MSDLPRATSEESTQRHETPTREAVARRAVDQILGAFPSYERIDASGNVTSTVLGQYDGMLAMIGLLVIEVAGLRDSVEVAGHSGGAAVQRVADTIDVSVHNAVENLRPR